eukprot:3683673-Prymnesium_polylepis.1
MQSGINSFLPRRMLGFDSTHCALSAALIYHSLEVWAVMDFALEKGRTREVLAALWAADISMARINKKHSISVVSTTVFPETSEELARLAHDQNQALSAFEIQLLIESVRAVPNNLPARKLVTEIIILYSCPFQLGIPAYGVYGLARPLTHCGAFELLNSSLALTCATPWNRSRAFPHRTVGGMSPSFSSSS